MTKAIAAVSDEVRYTEALRRVRLGYAWIREHGQPFDLDVDRLDPTSLDMRSGDDCALCQAADGGYYGHVLDALMVGEAIQSASISGDHVPGSLWGCKHGFSTYDPDSTYLDGPAPGHLINGILVTYDDLTRAWKQVIQEEREGLSHVPD